MARIFRTLLVCVPVLWVASCAKTAVKPTEDLRRVEAIQAFFTTLSEDLQAKRQAEINSHIHPKAPGADGLKAAIRKDFERAVSIDVHFALQRIRLEGDRAQVTLHWDGTWTPPPPRPQLKRKGSVTVTLAGNPPRILELAGDKFLGAMPK